MRLIRMEAATMRARLFRNNVGVATFPSGSRVKYGLCVGSSDLIGWTPVKITPAHVGKTLAVFTAVEVKDGRGKPTREQVNFLDAVAVAGGIAVLAKDDHAARDAIGKARRGEEIGGLLPREVPGTRR
jgi:hypothetical protein